MNYILVVDDEADIRDVFEVILKRSFPLDVVTASSGNKALQIITEKGMPSIIISDLNMPDGDGVFLYQKIKEKKWDIPFVICSTDVGGGLKVKFPDISGFIEKPDIVTPTVKLISSVISVSKTPPEYVPVRISLLLRWGSANYNLFMKLSDSKFVKVINAGEAFIPSDAERFIQKGLHHLYITTDDADSYLKSFQTNISMLMNSGAKKQGELSIITLESLETVERISKAVGWTPEVVEAAKHAVTLATKAVSDEPNLAKLLKQKMKNPESKFSTHVSILSLITCGFCHNLGWTSESTQMKLGLAALIHDLTVEESYYADINLWNQAASSADKSPEAVKYRNHPADAANLVLEMKNVPADVDQIILQHHETKEGTGFPRALISSRITPMACIFIISEDLINFVDESDNMDERIQMFLKLRESKYNSGNFKKVFEAFKESVEKAKGF